jgi:riboflavin-specific deaminase-like protein
MAQTIDGRIATATGHSQWISCPEALRLAHKLRARYDAVAVGSGTVREDDPQLTVRLLKGENPLRIIITTSPDLSPGLKVFRYNGDNNTIVATDKKTIKAGAYQSVITWPVKKTKGLIDLNNFLDLAGRRGVTSILFEGGQRLATTLLKQKLVDKLFLVIAPMIIGRGTETIGDLGIKTVNKALEFNEYGFQKIGTDTLFWGYPKRY